MAGYVKISCDKMTQIITGEFFEKVLSNFDNYPLSKITVIYFPPTFELSPLLPRRTAKFK